MKWSPERDVLGKVITPARLWLTPAERPKTPRKAAAAILPLPQKWLRQARAGDEIRFVDARKSARKLKVISVNGDSRWVECRKTAYVQTGTEFVLASAAASRHTGRKNRARLGDLPEREEPIVLHVNDTLVLTRKLKPGGGGAVLGKRGRVKRPAHIGCTAAEVFKYVKPGERVWLDDGKIGAVIASVHKNRLELHITHARAKRGKIARRQRHQLSRQHPAAAFVVE